MVLSPVVAVVAVTLQAVAAVEPAVTAPALVTVQEPVAVKVMPVNPEVEDAVHVPEPFTGSEAGQLIVTVWLAGLTTILLGVVTGLKLSESAADGVKVTDSDCGDGLAFSTAPDAGV